MTARGTGQPLMNNFDKVRQQLHSPRISMPPPNSRRPLSSQTTPPGRQTTTTATLQPPESSTSFGSKLHGLSSFLKGKNTIMIQALPAWPGVPSTRYMQSSAASSSNPSKRTKDSLIKAQDEVHTPVIAAGQLGASEHHAIQQFMQHNATEPICYVNDVPVYSDASDRDLHQI